MTSYERLMLAIALYESYTRQVPLTDWRHLPTRDKQVWLGYATKEFNKTKTLPGIDPF